MPVLLVTSWRQKGHKLGALFAGLTAFALVFFLAAADFFYLTHPGVIGLIVSILSILVFLVSFRVATTPKDPGRQDADTTSSQDLDANRLEE